MIHKEERDQWYQTTVEKSILMYLQKIMNQENQVYLDMTWKGK